jgi:hypothetical protein
MQLVLQPVLLVRAGLGRRRLREDVGLGVSAAKLEREQVVDLAARAVEVLRDPYSAYTAS